MSLLDIDSNINSQECIIRSWLEKNTFFIKHWGREDYQGPKIEIKNNIVNVRSDDKLKTEWIFHIKPNVKRIPTELFKFGEIEGNMIIEPGPYPIKANNEIESLEGLPIMVAGNLCVRNANQLKSFKGLPEMIGGHLCLEGTPIQLPEDAQYFPENVMGNIYVDLNDKDTCKAAYLYEKVRFLNGHVVGYYMEAYGYGELRKRYDRIFYNPREYTERRFNERRFKLEDIDFFK